MPWLSGQVATRPIVMARNIGQIDVQIAQPDSPNWDCGKSRPSMTGDVCLPERCCERPYIVQRILYSFLSINLDRAEQEVATLSDGGCSSQTYLAWGLC